MTGTVADLIADTRTHTDGAERGVLALLPAPLDDSPDPVTLAFGTTRVVEGTWLSVGLETLYVRTVTSAGSATVWRAQDGSTSAAHLQGAIVRVNPRFTDHKILAALNADIQSLPAKGLYRVRTADRVWDQSLLAYDLPADLVDTRLLDVRWKRNDQTGVWQPLLDYTVTANMPTDQFPSGTALIVHRKGSTGAAVRIQYRARFGTLGSLTDDVPVNTGLPSTALDIPPLGAAIRLMAGRPIQRAAYDRQSEPRRADEVRTTDVLQATAILRQQREERIADEVAQLTAVYPRRLVRR